MVRDSNTKGGWMIAILIFIVCADLLVLAFMKDAPASIWVIIGILEAVGIIGWFLAGKWQTTAHAEHEQFEVMGLILDQLNQDEINHILGELRQKNLSGFQKRIVERLIDEHCHIEVHL